MTAPITDFTQFTGLRVAAENNDPAALREVAGQFEALFLETMLKNMRAASFGDPIFGDNKQQEMYEQMLDQQLSVEMASGKGIGLADMLVRQLGGELDTPLPVTREINAARGVSVPATEPKWQGAEEFARDIWPHVQRVARTLNVTPVAVLAQAALETGWGKHVMGDGAGGSSLNLFGIKAGNSWKGQSVNKPTIEFTDGVAERRTERFRAYSDIAATFDDYARLLTRNPRYDAVSNHGDDLAGFAQALQESGYATDPAYAEKITRIAESPRMQKIVEGLKFGSTLPIIKGLVMEGD